MNFNARTPVIGPLLIILKSTRVIVALSVIVTGLLIAAIPELQSLQEELLTLITIIGLMVIGSYTFRDAESIARDTPPPDSLPKTSDEAFRKLVEEVLKELTNPETDT